MKEIKTYSLEELREIHETCTESDLITKNLDILQELGVEILLEASSLQEDKRLLIPIEHNRKLGLINHFAQVVVQPLYDDINVYDLNNCSTEDDLLRVTKKCNIVDYENMCTYEDMEAIGVINARGIQVLPIMYRYISINDTKNIFTVQRLKPCYGYGVRGLYNKEIIPFGKFHNISSFANGFARIIQSNKYGIIDLQGNVIITEGMFDKIWSPDAKYDSIVCEQGGVRYTITFEMLKHLQKEYISKGRIDTSIEDIMEYQKHLQGDFSNGWETIKLDTNEL
jgi:hypothetical protein